MMVAVMGVMRLRLGARISLGFGLLVVLLLGVAGFGGYGLTRVGAQIVRMDMMTANLRRADEILLRTEQIRRGLNRFFNDADAASMRDVTAAAARAASLLRESTELAISDKRRTLYETAAEKLDAAAPKIERLPALVTTAFAERARMFAAGDTLTEALGRLTDAAGSSENTDERAAGVTLQLAMSRARISATRFLALPDPKFEALATKEAEAARQTLSSLEAIGSPAVKSMVSPARAAFDSYTASFKLASSNLLDARALYFEQIRGEIRELERVVGEAQESLLTDLDATSRGARDVAASTQFEQLVLSAVGAALGVLIAWLIARAITRPVRGMTTAMARLAAGDTSITVPARDKTDEIGEMGSAVEVFRLQAIEKVEIAAERDRAQGRPGAVPESDGQPHAGFRRVDLGRDGKLQRRFRRDDSVVGRGSRGRTKNPRQHVPHGRWRGGIGARPERGRRGRRGTRGQHQRDQQTGRQRHRVVARGGGARQRNRRQGGRAHARGRADRRRGALDQRYRQPDQAACAERHHRGGARRRGWPRIRGRG
jgi:HAMP domain-containing protein